MTTFAVVLPIIGWTRTASPSTRHTRHACGFQGCRESAHHLLRCHRASGAPALGAASLIGALVYFGFRSTLFRHDPCRRLLR